jgi:putative RecB family exonuclease
MSLKEFRKSPHLSASSVGSYLDCGLAFKFSRIDKLPPEFRSDGLELGSVMHQVLADFNEQRMHGSILPVDALQEKFINYWTAAAEQREDIVYKEGKDFKKLLEEGQKLISVYYESRPWEDFKVVAVEKAFQFSIEGLAVPIIGVMDLVEEDASGTIVIVDYKTTGRAYSISDVDNSLQLTLYLMGAKANGFRDREILLRFDCLIKTKKAKFEQYYTTRDKALEERAAKKIIEVWKGISKGVFIPADDSWQCKNCGYKGYCDEWFDS